MVRFQNVFCSQCGQDFGPGEHGFSHCENHPGWKRDRMLKRKASARKAADTRQRKAIIKFNASQPIQELLKEMHEGPRIKTDLKDWTGSPRFNLDQSPKVKV